MEKQGDLFPEANNVAVPYSLSLDLAWQPAMEAYVYSSFFLTRLLRDGFTKRKPYI